MSRVLSRANQSSVTLIAITTPPAPPINTPKSGIHNNNNSNNNSNNGQRHAAGTHRQWTGWNSAPVGSPDDRRLAAKHGCIALRRFYDDDDAQRIAFDSQYSLRFAPTKLNTVATDFTMLTTVYQSSKLISIRFGWCVSNSLLIPSVGPLCPKVPLLWVGYGIFYLGSIKFNGFLSSQHVFLLLAVVVFTAAFSDCWSRFSWLTDFYLMNHDDFFLGGARVYAKRDLIFWLDAIKIPLVDIVFMTNFYLIYV